MWKPENDLQVQKAVQNFMSENKYTFSRPVEYKPLIDGVDVCIDDLPVLMIGLPPVSDYSVMETKHTYKYLKSEHRATM
ncbi:MAG: hypothetical protein FWH20_00710 [Oscillospiraceae bacterium]|nr:hypothetical protein [Oscillospiraceae bacterium]